MNKITQNNEESTCFSQSIENFMSHFFVSRLAKASNAQKQKGVPFMDIFNFLVTATFRSKTAYCDYKQHKDQLEFSDKTYRNTMNNGKISWEKLSASLGCEVAKEAEILTDESRKNILALDDSNHPCPNAKKAELSAKQFDHARHIYTRSYRFLQLGWSDGNTFIPVGSSLLSGSKGRVEPKDKIDHRTTAGKRRARALGKANEVGLELIENTLKMGTPADYVLFDSWFSNPTMFHKIKKLNIDCICMLRKSQKLHYLYQGEMRSVMDIYKMNRKRPGRSKYLLEVIVEAVSTETGETMPVKLVFVRKRGNKKQYLVLASSDVTLDPEEIIRLYGKRWKIEIFYKVCKQYLHLSGYQGLSYDGIYAHVAIVSIAYIILAVQQREQTDDRTIGDLFYLMVAEMEDMTYVQAIQQLLTLFSEAFKKEPVISEEELNNITEKFIQSLPIRTQKHLLEVA